MKMHSHSKVALCAAALLLIGAVAHAQSPAASRTTKPREASSGQASGRQDQFPKATGRQDQYPKASGAKSLGSAHATESLDAPAATPDASHHGQMGNAQSNPMYKDKGAPARIPCMNPRTRRPSRRMPPRTMLWSTRTARTQPRAIGRETSSPPLTAPRRRLARPRPVSKYPPAEPEALWLVAPQRGLNVRCAQPLRCALGVL